MPAAARLSPSQSIGVDPAGTPPPGFEPGGASVAGEEQTALFMISSGAPAVTSLAVGASGAIFGIFGAFIAYNYRRRHTAMAAANLRSAVTLIILNALLALGYRAIDWRAHLGGLVAGLAIGLIAEGFGSGRNARLLRAAAIVALVAGGVALAVWRTEAIRAMPQFQAFFG